MPKRLPRTAKPIPDAAESRETLRRVIRFPHDRDFVWVSALRLTDGTRIDVFFHSWTRRELLLGDDEAIFRRTPTGRYKAVETDDVLWRLIPHRWEWLEMGGYASDDVGPEPWPEDEEELIDDDDRLSPTLEPPAALPRIDLPDCPEVRRLPSPEPSPLVAGPRAAGCTADQDLRALPRGRP